MLGLRSSVEVIRAMDVAGHDAVTEANRKSFQ